MRVIRLVASNAFWYGSNAAVALVGGVIALALGHYLLGIAGLVGGSLGARWAWSRSANDDSPS